MNIGFSSWSIRTLMKSMSLLDAVTCTQQRFDLPWWEGCMSHFPNRQSPQQYFGTGLTNIVGTIRIDHGANGNLAGADQSVTDASIATSKDWLDFAASIASCRAVKINPGSGQDLHVARSSYQTIAAYASTLQLDVLIENSNDGSKGPLTCGDSLFRLLDSGIEGIGLVLDLGNFPEDGSRRLDQISRLLPYARAVEIKVTDSSEGFAVTDRELEHALGLGWEGDGFIDYSGDQDPFDAIDFALMRIRNYSSRIVSDS
ncbi:MAG: hypothetical protein EA401_07520 [Planctomycetota bacterium]|nr:MAG: hypothetical protein EA401_07520 [Planctomycetota bacterium]